LLIHLANKICSVLFWICYINIARQLRQYADARLKSSDFDETWYTTADIEPDDSHVTKNWNFLKFKMAAAAILKIALLAITHQPIVRFQRHFV